MPRQSLDGLRTHVIITKYQDRDLRELARKTGLTVAEHIRRALDLYIVGNASKLEKRK